MSRDNNSSTVVVKSSLSLETLGIITGIVLCILKACGVLAISWFWAIFPFWIILAVDIVIFLIIFLIMLIIEIRSNRYL